MFKKLFLTALLIFVSQISAFGANFKNPINEILNSFDFDRDSVVSISVKDKTTGLSVYEKHAYKFLNPASVLKIFTMAASVDTLGEDYKFETTFYTDKNNNLYLKLSGDPMLKSADLNALAADLKKNYKGKINRIFIDDSIMDFIPYPDGWMGDDVWPNAPKISPYMVDFNTVNVDFYVNENDIKIVQKNPYRFSFVNKLTIGSPAKIDFQLDETHKTINVEGTIPSTITNKEIPVLNPKYFFCLKLNEALNKNNIPFNDKFLFAKVPIEAVSIAKFSRPLSEVVKYTLENSDNLCAEMVFKVAGNKFAATNTPVKTGFTNGFGTTQNGINMFYAYCKKLNLDENQVKIKDASGVSRYNAMNANWITNALIKTDFNLEKYLPTPGIGTLSKRMRELNNKAFLKTGTLYGMSSLAGIIKTPKKEYCYASIIMSYNRNKSLIKGVEDEIVYEIYRAEENEEN